MKDAFARKCASLCRTISVSCLAAGAIRSECLLFPKADIQIVGNSMILMSAFGQKRTLVPSVELALVKL
jgi:hypothetical protein